MAHSDEDGSWFFVYLWHEGIGDDIRIPYWLQTEIAEYLEVHPSRLPNWWCGKQLEFDVIVSLANEIDNQKDFEILASILSYTPLTAKSDEGEGRRLHDAVGEAADKYAAWVRREYHRERNKFHADRDVCSICQVSKRIAVLDVCSVCLKEYAHEEQRIRIHLYRARKAGTPATLTLGQWINTLRRYNRRCAYCNTNPYEVLEHFVPITAGGGTTEENCVPGCRSCNSKKRDEHPERAR